MKENVYNPVMHILYTLITQSMMRF